MNRTYVWDGKRLKSLLALRDVTQQELSEKMSEFIRVNGLTSKASVTDDVKQQYVARWVSNYNAPNATYIAIMATILDANVEYLVGLSDNPIDTSDLTDDEIKLIRAKRENDHITAMKILSS